jgi:hypothetical protein
MGQVDCLRRRSLEQAVDAKQYREALAALGMSQDGARRFLHISKRSSHSYATGETRVLPAVALLLSVMVHYGVLPSDACRLAGLQAGDYSDRRRGRVHIGRKRRFIGKP